MGAFMAGTGYDIKQLMDNCPWESVGDGTVVDVSFTNSLKMGVQECQNLHLKLRTGWWLPWFYQCP